ncbi:MAG: hypothetical protein GX224_02130 [Thermoplasmatales archaeon]|nr:hypothetical protein [Thermoplasmatales archaeon]
MSDFGIIPLRTLLQTGKDEESVSKFLSSFICGKDEDLQSFLREKAIIHEKRDLSRTYLILRNDNGSASGIAGYITLALTVLSVPKNNELSSKIVRDMNLNRDGRSPAYLIGQISKNDSEEKGFGRVLMDIGLKILETGHEMFGCRTVCVDCREPLLDYYEKYGFKRIGEPSEDGLFRLVFLFSNKSYKNKSD